MSVVGQSEDGVEASTSGMMETTMMEGEEYYNPDDTGTWAQKEMSEQLCRICAKPNQYLIPIFEGEGIEHELEPKIQKHLPIEVSESDDLPLQVCYQCASTLIAWNDLVIACIEADKKLRQMHEQEEEDEDDKGAEFFDEPVLDSDEGEEPVEPSTSSATVASDTQSDATSHPKRSPGKGKKPKLKMTLVKSPSAGPSGLKSLPKRVTSKPKEDAGPEATERYDPSPTSILAPLLQLRAERGASKGKRPQPFQPFPPPVLITFQQHKQNISKPLVKRRGRRSKVTPTKSFREVVIKKSPEDHDYQTTCSVKSEDPIQVDHIESVKCESFEELDQCDGEDTFQDDTDFPIVNPKQREYECDICKKRYQGRSSLNIHMRIHSGERPYTCHVCGKPFRVKTGLTRHIREVHEGIKTIPCDICGRKFANNRVKDDHRRTHTGERPFQCTVCGKAFATVATLYTHNKYHSTFFPFPCSYCPKKFRTKPALNTHLLHHTKEKKHQCDICGKFFRAKNELTRHRRIHTSNETHACTLCGHTFKQKRYLKAHEKNHK